jgi:hypothetical protein
MNGILDDYCHLKSRAVIVGDCEQCLSDRANDPVCQYRNFVWGRHDEWKPLWVHRYETARKRVLALTPYIARLLNHET